MIVIVETRAQAIPGDPDHLLVSAWVSGHRRLRRQATVAKGEVVILARNGLAERAAQWFALLNDLGELVRIEPDGADASGCSFRATIE